MSIAVAQTSTAANVRVLLAQLDELPPPRPALRRLLSDADDSDRLAALVDFWWGDPIALARLRVAADEWRESARTISVERDGSATPATAATPSNLSASGVSIHPALIARVGLSLARRAALAGELIRVFAAHAALAHDDATSSTGLPRIPFWRHCLAVGVIAARLASEIDVALAEPAFDAGLLHDLGKAALDVAIPRSYRRIIEEAVDAGVDVARIERRTLGFDHTIAGRRVAERWALPAAIQEAAWLHHLRPSALPPRVCDRRLVLLVQLADALARGRDLGFSGNPALHESGQDAAAELGISLEGVERSASEAIVELAGLARLAGLPSEDDAQRVEPSGEGDERAALARWSRRAECAAAAARFASQLPASAAVRDVCRAAATELCKLLGIRGVTVYAQPADDPWYDVACAGAGGVRVDLATAADAEALAAAERDVLALAMAGTISAPVPEACAHLVERVRGDAGDAVSWLLPIHRAGRWAGGAVLSVGPDELPAVRAATEGLADFVAIIALAIEQARARATAAAWSDELSLAIRSLTDEQSEGAHAATSTALDEMAGGAAHELNNPLAVIAGRAQQLAAAQLEESERRAAEAIVEHAQRAAQIISDLAAVAQPTPPRPEIVDLAAWLPAWRTEWMSRAGLRHEELSLDVSDVPRPIVADPQHVRQTLDALIQNALDATDAQTRRLAVKAAPHPTDDASVIAVVDNGRGMTPEVRQRAFDPFFSQRPAGRGRGLGLTLARRLVLAAGGRIRLDRTPGGGVTAVVVLPSAPTN